MARRRSKRRTIKIPFIFLILGIGFFAISGVFIKNVITIKNLNEEKARKEEEYVELQEESEYLKNEIVKLKDPEYLAKYARENYDYSKDGELVIKIDKTENIKEDTNIVNKNTEMKNITYISLAMLFVISIVFVISLKKRNS